MRRFITTSSLLFFLFISPISNAENMRLSVTQPQKTQYVDTLSLPGKFVAKNEIAIGSPLQQQMVIDVFVEEGESVEKGQLLATLESPVQSAAVKQLQAETEKASAYIRQQKALSEQSQKELARLKPLARSGVISANDFEKAKSEALAQSAMLEASKAELRQLQAQLMKEQSQQDKSRIIAPVAGVISERHAIRGILSDNQLLFKIIENDDIEFEALAHASELKRLSSVETIVLTTSDKQQFSGKIRYISPKLDSISQLGKIRVSLDSDKSHIQIGESGVMTVSNAAKMQTTLPYSAIRTLDNGERIIFTVDNNVVKSQKVTVGRIQAGDIEILSPLLAELDVVTNAQAFLTENDTVTPVRAKP
ncbi:efflux RND transporter periplasmic adaptor subunit [Providencia stuartii]|uniref:efflux RND transporter periplasmic adaptor subunit n=1 Tax=Providencia stuartii TaxID=588 RepID=UPI001121DC66